MPVSNHVRRLLIETIADNINEMVIGFDGNPATKSDGAAGRPAKVINPTVRIVSDSSLLVEGFLGANHTFNEDLREVFVQFRGALNTIPIARHTIAAFNKTASNEIRIQILIEVK
jgi:hypothetical protein|tara:strand:- start:68 stop:412 length:345 start_codon:yes stop_codon:yes gene_type:complete